MPVKTDVTNCNDLDNEDNVDHILTDETSTIQEKIFDFDIPNDHRIELLNQINERDIESETIFEIITRLNSMYSFSQLKSLEKFLKEICKNSNIKLLYKLELAQTLCEYKNIDEHYNILFKLLDQQDNEELPIPCRIVYIKKLLLSDNFRNKAKFLLCCITNSKELEDNYRYKIILSIDSIDDLSKQSIIECTFFLCFEFISCKTNTTQYKILAIQNIYANCIDFAKQQDSKITNFLNENLKCFAQDTTLDYDLRADAADVLLHYSESPEYTILARDIINSLGRRHGHVRNLYQDAENVHSTAIEDSADEIIEQLSQIRILNNLDYDKVRTCIETILKNELESVEKRHSHIILALNRIECDRALYGRCNTNLRGILVRVWNYIQKQDNELASELKKRLLEELLDMSGKCSTGYAFRLVNSLSGFTNFNIKISYEDQIAGNLAGRLNANLRNIEDEDYKEKVMNEMTMLTDSGSINSRPNFLKFFRDSLPFIRHELWETFKEDIDDVDFDFYMRKAIARYEGHQEGYSWNF